MIVMQYANNGNLLSYLVQNINKLTWSDKLLHLKDIAYYLKFIHDAGLVHCDLHGGNIVIHKHEHVDIYDMYGDPRDNEVKSLICDFDLSQSVNSRESNSTIRGV